jgi:hypothetical protein
MLRRASRLKRCVLLHAFEGEAAASQRRAHEPIPALIGMPKRRNEQQLQVAWAARLTRPNLEVEPLSSNTEARRAAQDAWVASWGGASLTAEPRRKAWWKQSKKQHSELCTAFEKDQQVYGDSSQSGSTAASTAATVVASAPAVGAASSSVAALGASDAATSIASQASLGSIATAPATTTITAAAIDPPSSPPPPPPPPAAAPYNLRRRLHVGEGWQRKNAPSIARLTVGAFAPAGDGRHVTRTVSAQMQATPQGSQPPARQAVVRYSLPPSAGERESAAARRDDRHWRREEAAIRSFADAAEAAFREQKTQQEAERRRLAEKTEAARKAAEEAAALAQAQQQEATLDGLLDAAGLSRLKSRSTYRLLRRERILDAVGEQRQMTDREWIDMLMASADALADFRRHESATGTVPRDPEKGVLIVRYRISSMIARLPAVCRCGRMGSVRARDNRALPVF